MKKTFKKTIATVALAALTLGAFSLTGCSSNAAGDTASDTEATEADTTTEGAGDEDKVIKVGASVTPHAEILEHVKQTLADEGYTLEIVE